MILEALILSIIIGFIRKGSLYKLALMPLKKWYLFILPFLIGVAVVIGGQFGNPENYITYLRLANVIQYVIFLYAIYVNLHIKEIIPIGAGIFLNGLVIAVNNGMMPVSEKALRAAGLGYLLEPGKFDWNIRHVLMNEFTRLSFLGDIIPRPGIGKIMPEAASIGDVILAVGVFVLVQSFMCKSTDAENDLNNKTMNEK